MNTFKKNKYQVIRGAISKEVAEIGYRYLQISAEADHWMLQNGVTHENNSLIGNFKDVQVPNSYAKYSDRFMETLLIKTIAVMQKKTGLKLVPTYSYTRLYRTGNILRRHKDRPSCEISTTLNLGGDAWPIYLNPDPKAGCVVGPKIGVHGVQRYEPTKDKGIKVDLNPGDMLVYSGCELEHWREKFKGKECVQVFLHYNNRKTPGAKDNMFDKRPHLGLPSWFKR